jgi:hypothetical protein
MYSDDDSESWFIDSDDLLQTPTIPSIDRGQESIGVEAQSVTPNFEPGLNNMNMDEQLWDVMGIDQNCGSGTNF